MAHDSSRPRRWPDWALIGGIAAGVAALAVVLILAVVRPGTSGSDSEPAEQAPPYAAPASLPPRSPTPGPGAAQGADAAWLAEAADATGIPERALAAYAGASLFKAVDRPECGLGWNTLAAIGLVESDHGRHGGSRVTADGTVEPPIFGIALDGTSSAHIPDSDDGEIDGDPDFDRAVGPMQLVPQTWAGWHVDGNGDAVEDPHHIDDAVLAASNYLCRASPDMVDEEGWRTGILAYNNSLDYVRSVADAANRYATIVDSVMAPKASPSAAP
ncbi:MAG: hypothetical protein IR160_05895 [Salinibacterium sp.]|nr:hypothetical protein [Salinibacterium sp.]MBF0672100.1 hypothetical protein [Salinibacterium sp.]